MTIQYQRTVPIFRIFSLKKAREFHLDFLGFKLTVCDPFNNRITFGERTAAPAT